MQLRVSRGEMMLRLGTMNNTVTGRDATMATCGVSLSKETS